MRRPPALLLALAVVGSLFAAVSAVAAPADDCGPGLEGIRADGVVMCTHGNDEPPPGVDTTRLPSTEELWENRLGVVAPPAETAGADDAAATVAATGSSVACIGDGKTGPRVQLVYARAADVAGRYAAVVPLIQQHAADADSIVNSSAGRVGDGRRIRYVTDSGCSPQVLNVTLTTAGDDTFTNTINELRAQGLTDDDRKYLVFVDAAVGICGLGQVYLDDRAGADNANNSGRPMYSRVDTACWQHAAAHELLHTMGAVQNSAPNSSGAGHCTDEVDVMCYRDTATTVTRQVCNRAGQVDCNSDDYFHPNPEAGSYLATKWNVADSRFLETTSAPPPPAKVTVTVPSSGLAGVAWPVRVDVASSSATVVWSSTRADCVFSDAGSPRTTWSCPASAQGAAEVTVHVTDKGVVTPYLTEVAFATPSSTRPTAVTMKASTKKIAAGRAVTLTAAAHDARDSRAVHGLPVAIWSRETGSGQWQHIASGETRPDGRVRFRLTPTRNTVYTATTPESLTWGAATTTEISIRVKTKVSGGLKRETITRGRTAEVTGAVSPDKGGQHVRLERYSGGRWTLVMTRPVTQDSRYNFSFTVGGGAGRLQLRVVKPADADNVRGTTKPIVLSVR